MNIFYILFIFFCSFNVCIYANDSTSNLNSIKKVVKNSIELKIPYNIKIINKIDKGVVINSLFMEFFLNKKNTSLTDSMKISNSKIIEYKTMNYFDYKSYIFVIIQRKNKFLYKIIGTELLLLLLDSNFNLIEYSELFKFKKMSKNKSILSISELNNKLVIKTPNITYQLNESVTPPTLDEGTTTYNTAE